MSLLFDDSLQQYLERQASIPVVSYPFAISCWIYIDDDSINQTLVCLTDRNQNVNYFALQLWEGKIRAKTVGENGHIEQADSVFSITPNGWHHAMGIWNSEVDIEVYLDGENPGASPGSADGSGGLDTPIFFDSSGGLSGPLGLDTIAIGRLSTLTKQQYVSGRIAEVTIWDNSVKLTADEVLEIGLEKLDPLFIRTDEIVFHVPIATANDPTIDIINGYDLNLFNAPTVEEHPPLQYYDPETFMRFRSGPIEFNTELGSGLLLQAVVNYELVKPVSNSIGFQQNVQHNVVQIHVQHSISFQQALARNNIILISVSHSLSFNQAPFGPTYEENPSNDIQFTAEAFRAENPDNDIEFTQDVDAVASKGVDNDIQFTQSLQVNAELTQQLSQGITFDQKVVAFIERNCDLQEYTPWGVAPAIVFGDNDSVTFDCGIDSITLRNPEFGNSESLSLDRALNVSRGGTPNLFREDTWPESTTHRISFTVLTEAKAQELLDFLKNCIGKLVTYTDHENRQWQGVILNPESAITDGGNCKFSAELQIIANEL